METVLDSKAKVQIDEQVVSNSNPFSLASTLTLTDHESIAGYYWCTVNTSQSTHPTPNPSQVLNISLCPFTDYTVAEVGKCTMPVDLFERQSNRCADQLASIEIVPGNVQFPGICMIDDDNNKPTTTLGIKEPIHTSEPSATTDSDTSDESTTADGMFTNHDQSTSSPSSGFPMHYVWMIVAIAFTLLLAIIIVMLIAIIYLNHKKNKIRGIM